MFDFEQQEFDPNISGNDLRVDLTGGANTFIVAKPTGEAAGIYLKTVSLGGNFDLNSYYGACHQNINNFLTGTKPMDNPGDLFCWMTNEHRLAVFVIEKITGPVGNWNVEIRYLVWTMF